MLSDFLATVALHELSHIATALLLKVRIKQVGLHWRGPYIRREPGTDMQNVAISLAGPGMNLLLAAATWNVNHTFALYNLVLGAFNILPIPSSDGARVMRLLKL